MLRTLPFNLTGFMGKNQVLNAWGCILSFIKERQLSQTDEALIFI